MNTVTLSPMVLLGGAGMILVALGFVVYAAWRRLSWAYLGLGALAWVITVAVKFLWSIPLNARVDAALTRALPGAIGAGAFDLYVGLLTGLTEVTLVWLVMRYTRLGRVTWERALAFGIGFGALEALLLGLGSLATMLTALLAPQTIPSSVMPQLVVANNLLHSLAPIVERFFTVWVHIFANVLIFFAVAKMQTRWFWLAFWYKSLIDAVTAFAQTSGVIANLQGIWTIEAVIVVWGVVGWLGVGWVKRRYTAPQTTSPRRGVAGELVTVATLILAVVVMTAGAVFAAAVPQAKSLTGSARDAVLAYTEPMTDNLMNGLNRNDYVIFSRDFDAKMKSAIDANGLEKIQTSVTGKIGDYVSRQVSSVTQSGNFVTVVYNAKFKRDDQVTLRVTFDAAAPHQISGLWFDSPTLRQP